MIKRRKYEKNLKENQGYVKAMWCGDEACEDKIKEKLNKFLTSSSNKKYIQEWKAGKVSGLRGEYQISMHIKTYLLKKYNNKCGRCGWGEMNVYTQNIPLEVEHIDGNYMNNKEENLILLCPNCHSLTQTYKGANRNHGRQGRKKYMK